jgi:mono/diheme cytochrome c family protein
MAAAVCAAALHGQEQARPSGPVPPTPAQPARPNFFGLAPPPDPASVARGEETFVANCGFCHGSTAKGGNGGPDLVRSVLVLHDEGSGTLIGPVVLGGRPDRGMPKFPLTSQQVKDIAAYLMARSQATVLRGEYKILNVVTGDAAAGRTYFAAHCANCHSPQGDLEHVADRYDPATLQARFVYPRVRSAKFPVTATVTLPSGKTVSGVVNSIDDFNIALTDASGQYYSWMLDEGNGVRVALRDPLQGHEDLLRRYTDADMHNILAYLETLK